MNKKMMRDKILWVAFGAALLWLAVYTGWILDVLSDPTPKAPTEQKEANDYDQS